MAKLSWYCRNLAQRPQMTRLPSFPQAPDKEKSCGFLFELIAMIDILFTCNPSVAEREWISCQLFPLSIPLSSSLLFSAGPCQNHKHANNKSRVQLTQQPRTYRNICSASERTRGLSGAHPWWFCHNTWHAPKLRKTNSPRSGEAPKALWRTGKLTTDYCKLWK